MKIQFLAALLGVVVLAAGCHGTLDGRSRAGVPWIKDTLESKYERPPEQVFAAAREVVRFNGAVTQEGTDLGTNAVSSVRWLVGKVNARNVWIRVQPVDARVTGVSVQVRSPGGTKDTDLMAELSKQIALQLAR